MGYIYLKSTLRRALAQENYFRCMAKSQPFISDKNRVYRIDYVDIDLPLPLFYWDNVAWTDEGYSHLGGYANVFITRQPGPQRLLKAC
jgi:hypothetical protein